MSKEVVVDELNEDVRAERGGEGDDGESGTLTGCAGLL